LPSATHDGLPRASGLLDGVDELVAKSMVLEIEEVMIKGKAVNVV